MLPAIYCIFICAHCNTKICLIITENALSTSIGTWLILSISTDFESISYSIYYKAQLLISMSFWPLKNLNVKYSMWHTVCIITEIGHMTNVHRKIEKAVPLLVERIWFAILQNLRENFRKMLCSKWYFRISQRIKYNCCHFYWIQPNHEKDFRYFISAVIRKSTSGEILWPEVKYSWSKSWNKDTFHCFKKPRNPQSSVSKLKIRSISQFLWSNSTFVIKISLLIPKWRKKVFLADLY